MLEKESPSCRSGFETKMEASAMRKQYTNTRLYGMITFKIMKYFVLKRTYYGV